MYLPGYAVRLTSLPEKTYALLKQDLRFNNGAYFQAEKCGAPTDNIPRYLYGYVKDDKYIYLPRHLDWRKYGLDHLPAFRAHPRIKPVELTSFEFRDKAQKKAYRALEARIEARRDGILSLAPAKGKTVLSVIAWACMVNPHPALVVVTQLRIGTQWKDRLLELTDIDESDIGQIGDNKESWKGKKFVVATLQSLAQKEFPEDFYTRFGVVFFDEVHRLGAPSFAKVAGLFTGTRIGLSATWARADGLEKLFMLHVGKVFYEDRTQTQTPDIYFVRTPVDLHLKKFRMWSRGANHGEINHARVVTYLSRLPERQEFILEFALKAHKKGRKVLVLGDRKEELMMLMEKVPHNDKGICVGSLDGRSLKQDEQQEALNKGLIFATSQLVKEGLDQPDIDTLIILYPQANEAFAEQAPGRILRRLPGKQQPIIVVLCDSGLWIEGKASTKDWTWGGTIGRVSNKVYPFKRTCERMQATFKKLGYNVVREVK